MLCRLLDKEIIIGNVCNVFIISTFTYFIGEEIKIQHVDVPGDIDKKQYLKNKQIVLE